jgi:microcystin-dependent protein
MASPFIQYDNLTALASNGGYNPSPALNQLSAVFLLSSCLVMRQKWLWQNPIAPITENEYEDILTMIEQAEADLMTSFGIGQIIPSVGDMSVYTNVLRLDGSTVLQADYPELTAVVPATWLSGADIQLPDMREKSLHGDDTTNVGAIVGANTVTLTIDEMPAHTHTQQPHSHSYTQTSAIPTAAGVEPTFADLTTQFPSVTGNATAVNNDTGGDQPHNNVPESLSVFWWIVAR